jgi:hypothetical protein
MRKIRRSVARDFLPPAPVSSRIDPWWVVKARPLSGEEQKKRQDDEAKLLADCDARPVRAGTPLLRGEIARSLTAGEVDKAVVERLAGQDLIYFDVPVHDDETFSGHIRALPPDRVVPLLQGFVMNRVLGDPFEEILYKIFVSIDEKTNLRSTTSFMNTSLLIQKALAETLDAELTIVKVAVSFYCRVGFVRKRNADAVLPSRRNILIPLKGAQYHPSWTSAPRFQKLGGGGNNFASTEMEGGTSDVSEEAKPSLVDFSDGWYSFLT